VQRRTNTVLRGTFVFGGEWFTNAQALIIYPRARLTIINLASGSNEVQLVGYTNRSYAVDRIMNLRQTNWFPLQYTQRFAGTILKWTNSISTPKTNYFYRSRE